MRAPRASMFIATLIASIVGAHAALAASAFDHAIETALPRAVKLYGVGAGAEAGYGSGVLVSSDGYVLSVYSLLSDAREISAVLYDGSTFQANVVYRDPNRQLVLMKLVPQGAGVAVGEDLPPIDRELDHYEVRCGGERSPCPEPAAGDWVVAAGNAFKVADGAEPVSIAHGVFSTRTKLDARRRRKDFAYAGEVLIIDAITSNPGAPGSALVDLEGRLVGLIGREVVSNRTHTHLNYAMPRDELAAFMEEALVGIEQNVLSAPKQSLADAEPVDLGLRISKAGYQTVLPFVERVKRGSPAKKAGVRKDDLVLSVNGHSVSDIDEYETRIRRVAPGEPVDLVLRRGRRIVSVRIETSAPAGEKERS